MDMKQKAGTSVRAIPTVTHMIGTAKIIAARAQGSGLPQYFRA